MVAGAPLTSEGFTGEDNPAINQPRSPVISTLGVTTIRKERFPSMRILIYLVLSTIFLSACRDETQNVNPNDYYAPKLLSDEKTLAFVVPVEIEQRNKKKSFVKLFEIYGFSGNGPSIEQVVRYNAPNLKGSFDSEGDAFVLIASNKPDYESTLLQLKCLEDMKCLIDWLMQAKSIVLKE